MIVDDEEPITRMLQAMLQRFLAAQTLTFNQPRQALDHFARDPSGVDLLISDLKMPEMDGLELCGRIRQVRSDLPIVILTAYESEDIRDEARRIGVSALVQKPCKIHFFINLIRSVLEPEAPGAPPASESAGGASTIR